MEEEKRYLFLTETVDSFTISKCGQFVYLLVLVKIQSKLASPCFLGERKSCSRFSPYLKSKQGNLILSCDVNAKVNLIFKIHKGQEIHS